VEHDAPPLSLAEASAMASGTLQEAPGVPRSPRTIADLQAGDHLCCLYETAEEHRAVLNPFLREGLGRGEKVICIVDARTAETILGYLSDDGLDPAPFLAAGQLAIPGREETCLPGSAFDPEGMILLLRSETERALAEGYSALRVTGEMTWALRGLTAPESLIRHEVLLNEFLPGSRCLAICQYDRRRFVPGVLLDVLRTHPNVAIGTGVCASPHFVSSASFYGAGRAAAELDSWLRGMVELGRGETALRGALRRLEHIIEGSRAGTWETNVQTGESVVNERWAEIVGWTLAELGPDGTKAFRTLTHPDDLKRSDELLQQHYAGELPSYECEVRMRHKDGHWVWVQSRGSVISRAVDGRPLLMFGTHTDITERRNADEAARVDHARMRRFIDANIVGVAIARTDGSIVEANDYYLDLIGYARDELMRGEIDWRAITPPEWLPVDERALRELSERGVCTAYEKEYVRRDGRRVQVIITDAMLPGAGGEIVAFVLDISGRTHAERALRESEEKYRVLTESMKDVVWTLDTETLRFLYVSPSVQALRGFTPEDVIAEPMDAALTPEGSEHLKSLMRERVAEARARGDSEVTFYSEEVEQPCKDGTAVWTEVVHAYYLNTKDDRVEIRAVTRDITERRRAQEEIRTLNEELEKRVRERTAKLEEANRGLESFSYSISHDLRAPLRAINGFASMLERHQGDVLDEKSRHYLDGIEAASERMGILIEELLDYSRLGRESVRTEPVPLEPLVAGLRSTFGERIAAAGAILEVVEPLAVPAGDPTLIERILANLLENALVYRRPDVAPRVTLSSTRDGDTVTITVADNGIGIAPEYRERVFEVFARLHADEKYPGTGIGLSVVRKAARLMGSDVTVESVEGEGSTFSLTLRASGAGGSRARHARGGGLPGRP
jgi:PAS domain S-box-containing protein